MDCLVSLPPFWFVGKLLFDVCDEESDTFEVN